MNALAAPTIPGYRIVRELGAGGMAQVFLAVQESLGREVALKLMSPRLAADPVSAERFLREARIAARLEHRNIVSIFDVGIHDGQPYLAMERMPDGAVSTGAPHPPDAALRVAHDIALALDHAHREGVIHRDLKPENILRRRDGSFALADFGIARASDAGATLTQEGTVVGTPFYMSPEQLTAQAMDGRSDLYSLGVVLFQLLTGDVPYRGSGDVPVGVQHVHAPVPRLPEHLSRLQPLLDALLAKSPAARPASGADVARRIEALQSGVQAQVATQVLTPAPRAALPDLAPQAQATLELPRVSQRWHRFPLWIAAAMAAVIVGAALWAVLRGDAADASGGAATASAPSKPASVKPGSVKLVSGADESAIDETKRGTDPQDRSIAVLPFVDLSQTHDQEYLGDGLAEEILNQLAQLQSLRLVGRTSSFSFKGKNEDLRVIGQKLGVAHLLEGSVRKSGERLRITAQLIRADDGTHLWSKTYARELKDVFAVQDEIAKDVATALSVKLEAGDLTRAAGGTTNVEAYEKLLRAREADGKGGRDNTVKAAQFLREAVELDPDFGAASAALVWVLQHELEWSPEHSAAASREIADIVARNVQSAPAAPWTLQLQGQNHLSHYRWAEAEAALRAVQKTTFGARRTVDAFANPPIYFQWSWVHSTGQMRESARMGDEWARVDPLNGGASFTKILWLMYVGRDEEALAEYARAKELGMPAEWPMLTRLLRRADTDPAALKAQFAAIGADKAPPDSLERKLFDNLGKPQALRAVLQSALDAPASAWVDLENVAIYADGFGERDLALAALRKNLLQPRVRNPHRMGSSLWYPYKTRLRADPRFKDIVREIGLVDYWRKTGEWGDFCTPVGKDDFACQ